MENNANRVQAPSVGAVAAPQPVQQLPPRPPLNRNDSRPSFPQQQLPQQPQPQRPNLPPGQQPLQQRPAFQPGGPVTHPPQQFAPRPGTPAPRGPAPPYNTQQGQRPQPPQQPVQQRPVGPQPFNPQQGPRPLQPGAQQRAPPPSNLQFGPRQPAQFGAATTPDGSRQTVPQSPTGVPRNGAPIGLGPIAEQLPRQPSQGSLKGFSSNNTPQTKPANLDSQNISENPHDPRNEMGMDMPGAAKNRSYSVAAPPGAPSPLKIEDDRRKSISTVGAKIDDLAPRIGLGQIKENIRTDSQESFRDNIRADSKADPQPRMVPNTMTDSFIGSLPGTKKRDDDDDVVLQNSTLSVKPNQNRNDLSDRSPSLSRSEDSPEQIQRPAQNSYVPGTVNQNGAMDYQRPKTPKVEAKPPAPETIYKKPTELYTSNVIDSKPPRKAASAPKYRTKDGDNDSGVDESTQGHDINGSPGSPNKRTPSKLPLKEKSSSSLKPSLSRSSSKSATAKTPENPPIEKKKIPMNKVQVGNAPSPNIKAVRSKIGSLENATYKPGGGKVKIENKKVELTNVTPRIAAKNDSYVPSGGTKKITTTKLEWNAKSKIGSLQNASYKPGGGDKKIETVKLDFKDKAKPKVASTANISHKPGGGAVKIENQKLEFKAESKVGSMDNVKHKPKGGDVKIFDDKEYIRQMSDHATPGSRTLSRQEDYCNIQEWSDEVEQSYRCRSAMGARTPRVGSPRRRKSVYIDEEESRVIRNNDKNRRMTRPASAREPPRSACRTTSISQRPAFRVY